MKYLFKINLIVIIIFSTLFPVNSTFALKEKGVSLDERKLVLYSENKENIDVYEDEELLNLSFQVENDKDAILISESETFGSILVELVDDSNKPITGYVSTENIKTMVDEAEIDSKIQKESDIVGKDSIEAEVEQEVTSEEVVKEEYEEIAPLRVMTQKNVVESRTSLLGHLKSSNVNIYKTIGGNSVKAGSTYTHAVYYIKKQAKVGQETYYQISRNPTYNIVGWVKSTDLSTAIHKGLDKQKKAFTIKGIDKGTTKAWGGRKDAVYTSMSNFKGYTFNVNLTEKVGNRTWYRGQIENKGQNIWLPESAIEPLKISESKTSLLGHLKSNNVNIYKTIGGNSVKAGSTYTHAVYYIKKQAKVGQEIYYQISRNPSYNIVGWVKSTDLSTAIHKGLDKQKKAFTIKGIDKGTTKAWGGRKDAVHTSMSNFKGYTFNVNLTEKVGNRTWYRGQIENKGQNIWLPESAIEPLKISESKTSLLGHLKSNNVNIYKTIGGNSVKAGSTYTRAVYYIKKQAKVGQETYYQISQNPTYNIVGWVKSTDLTTQIHKGIDTRLKDFYVKGNGKSTTKAWGGNKDTVYQSLTAYKNKKIKVNLTEKVGNTIWYRGKINNKGPNMWLSEGQVNLNIPEKISESNTSLLGHLNSVNTTIYKTIEGPSFKAGTTYTHAVYYIKKQAKVGQETYYQISRNPTYNIVGWVKSSEIKTQKHVGVDNFVKEFSIKGNGKSTTKAWGGNKDNIHSNLSSFKDEVISINLTERVGNTLWYRGKINNKGANMWVSQNQVNSSKLIVLDAGHGGSDPGASRNGVIEKEVVLDVTLRVEKILQARGYNVILTRNKDVFVELSERSNIANRNKADTFLSIHANSGGGIGVETWWYNANNGITSQLFAQAIQNGVIGNTSARDRGIKHGNLSVNRESNMTSALLEIGFVDNVYEASQLKNSAYRNRLAIGIANGFDSYYK